jgi:hypothetical protein
MYKVKSQIETNSNEEGEFKKNQIRFVKSQIETKSNEEGKGKSTSVSNERVQNVHSLLMSLTLIQSLKSTPAFTLGVDPSGGG